MAETVEPVEPADSRHSSLKQEEDFLKRFSLRKFTVPKDILTDRSAFSTRPKTERKNMVQKLFRIEYKELKRALNTNIPWWLRALALEEDLNAERLVTLVEESKEKVSCFQRLIPFNEVRAGSEDFECTKLISQSTSHMALLLPQETSILRESLQKETQTVEHLINVVEEPHYKIDFDTRSLERRLSRVLRTLNSLEYARLDSGCDRCHGNIVNKENRIKSGAEVPSRSHNHGDKLCVCDLEDVDMEIEHLCNCLAKSLASQSKDKCYYKDIIERLKKIRKSLNEFIKKATSSHEAFIPEKLEKIEYFIKPELPQTKTEKAGGAPQKSKPKKEHKSTANKKCKTLCCCGLRRSAYVDSCEEPVRQDVLADMQCFELNGNAQDTDIQRALCVCCTETENKQENVPKFIPCLVLNQVPTDGQSTTFDLEKYFPKADYQEVKRKSTRATEEREKVENNSKDRRFCSELVNFMGIGQDTENNVQKTQTAAETGNNTPTNTAGKASPLRADEVTEEQAHSSAKTAKAKAECNCPCQRIQKASSRHSIGKSNEKVREGFRVHKKTSKNRVREETKRRHHQNHRTTSEVDVNHCDSYRHESKAQKWGQKKRGSEVSLGKENAEVLEISQHSIHRDSSIHIKQRIEIEHISEKKDRQSKTAAAQSKQAVETHIVHRKESIPCRCNEITIAKKPSKPKICECNSNQHEQIIRICPERTQKSSKSLSKKVLTPDTGMNFCYDCFGKDVPIIKKDLAGELRKIIGNRKRNSVFLKFTVFKCNLYHMQVCTDNDYLGCLYATESATFEARKANGFDGCITMTVTDTLNTLAQIECLVDHAFMVVQQGKLGSY